MYLIISWFYSLRKISGIVPEPKLKNWIFQRDPGRDFPYGFSFSVFQFFCFAYGTIPEYFRRHFGIFAEKLKNWKTEFSREIQEEILHMDSVFQFFCFSVLLTELFRNISGDISEYLRRNWKTEFSREIQEEILHMDSVFLFFSFCVFLFCLRNYSGIFPETFRNICGETEKLKNWIFQRDPGRDSPYGFSFSVFQFFCFSVLLTELFRNISGDISEYLRRNWKTEFSREIQEEILHMDSVFQFCLRNYSGIFPETFQNICGETEKLKNWISREIQEEILHMDSVFLFFCFSVLLTELFRNISGDISEYLRRNWKLNFPERSRKRFSNGFSF